MRPLSRTASTGERSRRSGYPNSAGPAMNSSPFRIPPPMHITTHISSQCRAKCQTWLPRPGLVVVVSYMPAGPFRRLRAGRSGHRTVSFRAPGTRTGGGRHLPVCLPCEDTVLR